MSRFTIKNLKDVEDSAGERLPGVEGRFARKYLDSEHLGISYFRYAPGVRSAMAHSHREQEEAYVVVAARAGSASTMRSTRSANGTSSASAPRRFAPSRPGPRGSS